jgi:hypothetical protein
MSSNRSGRQQKERYQQQQWTKTAETPGSLASAGTNVTPGVPATAERLQHQGAFNSRSTSNFRNARKCRNNRSANVSKNINISMLGTKRKTQATTMY